MHYIALSPFHEETQLDSVLAMFKRYRRGEIANPSPETQQAIAAMFDLPVAGRILIALIVGAAAGAAVGSVFFGGAVAESESEDSEGDESVIPEEWQRASEMANKPICFNFLLLPMAPDGATPSSTGKAMA